MAKTELIYGDMYAADKYVRLRFAIYKSLLTPFLKDRVKVLDIGCYTGDMLKLLPPSVDYYGIDVDGKALEIAETRGAKVIRLDLETGIISLDQKFDIIVAAELLEHLKDPERLILQIKQLLKEGGVVLLSLPNECTIYHRLKVLMGKGIDGTGGFASHYHLHFPTIKQNDQFIERHFQVIKRRYWIHTGEGKIAKVLSKIPDRVWLALAKLRPSLFARGVIYLVKNKDRPQEGVNGR